MKTSTTKFATIAAVSLCVALAFGMSRAEQDPPDAEARPQLADAVDLAQPGVVHQDMMSRAGEYVTVTRMRPTADAEWMSSEGTASLTTAIGGRFLKENSSGTMMGQEVQSQKMWGFNNASGKIESVWTYNMSTAMLIIKGAMGEDGVIRLEGTWDEAAGPETVEIALWFPNADQFVIEMISHGMDEEGEAFVAMETTYTRTEN